MCFMFFFFFLCVVFFFFFKQKTAYEIVSRDWSSDVCSSDLTWQYSVTSAHNHLGDWWSLRKFWTTVVIDSNWTSLCMMKKSGRLTPSSSTSVSVHDCDVNTNPEFFDISEWLFKGKVANWRDKIASCTHLWKYNS